MHIHLDALGGMAGDMFAAAMIDACAEVGPAIDAALKAVDLPVSVSWTAPHHSDGTFTGRRFVVVDDADEHDHSHRSFADIEQMLRSSDLDETVSDRAISIFERLAVAEGRVHGVDAADVTFHEVGAWDSIADVVAAAAAIVASGGTTWSVSPLPLGSGRVMTAHGVMPVPAPATTILLEGLPVIDDGIGGERVTPTGAAIVADLSPALRPPARPMTLAGSGHGFGTKVFDGIPNLVRVVTSVPTEAASGDIASDVVAVIAFEVDDQTPEDLAIGLDHLRATTGVLDVVSSVMMAKKGRMTHHVRILATAEHRSDVITACFMETTTIGVRHSLEQRTVLPRAVRHVERGSMTARVKVVDRPGGPTAKADIDDVAAAGGHSQRTALSDDVRRAVEENE